MVSANLQAKKLHDGLLQTKTGSHVSPDAEQSRRQLLPQVAQPHSIVQGHKSPKEVQSGDQMLQDDQMFLLPGEDVHAGVRALQKDPSAAEQARFLPGHQDLGEESEECVVESFGLRAAAVHQRVDDSAHQNKVHRLGWRDE